MANSEEDLKKNGFAVFRSFFSDRQCQLISGMTARLEQACGTLITVENAIRPAKLDASIQRMIIKRDNLDATKVQVVHNTLDVIPQLKYISKGLIEPLLAQLTGEEWCMSKDKFLVRGKGSVGTKPHQDIASCDFDPNSGFFKSSRTLTVQVSVDWADTGNACMRYAANYMDVKHEINGTMPKDKYLPWVDASGALLECVTEKLVWTDVETAPNDLLVFDEYIPHTSGRNDSNRTRKSFYLTYIPLRFTATHDAYYKTTAREMFK